MDEFIGNGAQIAYIDIAPVGQNLDQPILLIHGFASTHAVNWVFPHWVKTLTEAGRRVIAFDNRGHGRSQKFYDSEAYGVEIMAADALALLDHLNLGYADVMGYSMGARIGAFLTLAHPNRVRSLILGGLGSHLIDGVGLPNGIADAMEAPSLETLTHPTQRMFRSFAEATKSDLKALAACIRGSRQTLDETEVAKILTPTLVAVGTDDDVAGSAQSLAAIFPKGAALDIPGRDHNRAVGDKVYKKGVLKFLNERA
jgi:pimeloyl-ACP methyl ester carboxylesterase